MNTADWTAARNLLCVRLDTIGDVLMTTPAVRALRAALPGRRITLLTSDRGAEAAALVPEVDDIIVHEAPWMKTDAPADPGSDQMLIEELRCKNFDGAVIFTVCTQSALPAAMTCYLAGIPLRLAHCRENPYRLLTHWVPENEPVPTVRHEAQRQLGLVAAIGVGSADQGYSMSVPDGVLERMRGVLEQNGIRTGDDWCVIHPGASAPSRRYPAESFARVAESLFRHGWRIVLTGSGDELGLVKSVHERMGAPSLMLAGGSVADLAAVISLAPLVISNNSSPVHIASAVGTPVVALYALTNPQHGPWLVRHRVLSYDVPCRFCYKSVCPEGHNDCLRLVTPEQVVAAALELAREDGGCTRLPAGETADSFRTVAAGGGA
jgi:lipopolysaccharide heptosyltransferase II